MKTVLEIIKGLGANGKGKEGFVTMGADTSFVSEYLYAHLSARTVVCDGEFGNETRYSLKKGGGMIYVEYLGSERIGNTVNDNYKVTYRTAQGTYYVVNAASMDSKATEYVRKQAVSQFEDACAAEKLAVTQAATVEIIETPAVETASEAQEAMLGLIQTLAAEQAASADGLIELPAKTCFIYQYVRGAMLDAGRWEAESDDKEMTAVSPTGATLTVREAPQSLQDGVLYRCETVTYKDAKNYHRLYFISPDTDGSEWLQKRAEAMQAGLIRRPLASLTPGLDFDALPIAADYILESVSRNHIWGSCISARPVDFAAEYLGKSPKGKHRFCVPQATGDERFPEYTDLQLARALKAVPSV